MSWRTFARCLLTLSVCLRTEAETGENSDCPDASPDAVSRSLVSTWQPPGPTTATVSDAVSADWSVLQGRASVYARYDDDAVAGFANDFNGGTATLDANDFLITGPPGPVLFTLNVFVDGAVHASSTDP